MMIHYKTSDLRDSTSMPASSKLLEAVYNLHVKEARSRELFCKYIDVVDQGSGNCPGFDDKAEMSFL